MTTQNLEYSEDVKAFPLVADAFSKRDDIQQDVDATLESMDELRGRLDSMQATLDQDEALLAIADDKLAMVATMAQDQIDALDRAERTKAAIREEIESLVEGFLLDAEDSVASGSVGTVLDEIKHALDIVTAPTANLEHDGT